MALRPLVYVDACCFIDAVKLGAGRPLATHGEEDKRRREDCWFLKGIRARRCDH
jgi:hypothetical protein